RSPIVSSFLRRRSLRRPPRGPSPPRASAAATAIGRLWDGGAPTRIRGSPAVGLLGATFRRRDFRGFRKAARAFEGPSTPDRSGPVAASGRRNPHRLSRLPWNPGPPPPAQPHTPDLLRQPSGLGLAPGAREANRSRRPADHHPLPIRSRDLSAPRRGRGLRGTSS